MQALVGTWMSIQGDRSGSRGVVGCCYLLRLRALEKGPLRSLGSVTNSAPGFGGVMMHRVSPGDTEMLDQKRSDSYRSLNLHKPPCGLLSAPFFAQVIRKKTVDSCCQTSPKLVGGVGLEPQNWVHLPTAK